MWMIFFEYAQAMQPGMREGEMTLVELLEKGGWVMAPLALVSLLVLGVVIFNFFWLRQRTVASDRFLYLARQRLKKKDLSGLIEVCSQSNESCAKVLGNVLAFARENPGVDLDSLKQIADAQGNRQSVRLGQPNLILADLAVIAPLLGLLGTVTGIIHAFGNLAQVDVLMKGAQFATGIYNALVTTATGLVIAIIAMLFYSFFRTRLLLLVGWMEAHLSELIVKTMTILAEKPVSISDRDDALKAR